MSDLKHGKVPANGIEVHYVEQGDGSATVSSYTVSHLVGNVIGAMTILHCLANEIYLELLG